MQRKATFRGMFGQKGFKTKCKHVLLLLFLIGTLTWLLSGISTGQAIAQTSPFKGVNLGQPVNPLNCEVNQDFLQRIDTLLPTTVPNGEKIWIRLDLIGMNNNACKTAYVESIFPLLELPSYEIIGLLSNDFIFGGAQYLSIGILTQEYKQLFTQTAGTLAQSQTSSGIGDIVDYWQVWNEPNRTETELEACEFTTLLAQTQEEIHISDPGSTVISGAITGDLRSYFDLVDQCTTLFSPDGVGIHAYTSEPGNLEQFVFEAQRFGKPIYITEFGWKVDVPNYVQDTGIPAVPSEEQCNKLNGAYDLLEQQQASRNIAAAVWFTLQDFSVPDGIYSYGLFDVGSTARPSLGAFNETVDCSCVGTNSIDNPESERVDNICPTATLQYVSRGSYGVGTNCANPTASPSSNNWRFRADGIPVGFEPVLLSDGGSAIWRKAPPCDSVSRWPLVATRDVSPGIGNTYGWTIDVVGWPGTLPTQGRTYSLTRRNGGNDFIISTIARP